MVPRTPELLALFGIVGVHLVPKLLQRLKIPAPVTALVLGALVARFVPGLSHDPTLALLSTIGIAALFLFAGLEVDAEVLGEKPALLLSGLCAHAIAIAAATSFAVFGLNLETAPAMILALGIVTPSGGFILDGLAGLGATPVERHAIRDTALLAEILSLVLFFFVTQSTSVGQIAAGIAGLTILLVLVPVVLRFLVRVVVPHAPNSEFPLLVLVAIVGAYATRRLNLYYLIGAFVVGIVARRLRKEAPELASDRNLSAIELFAAFFAPFYFARAGMEFDASGLGLRGVGLGAVLLVFGVPMRVALVSVARHLATGEPMRRALRVSTAIVPTFVFSLVMGAVIADRYPAAAWTQGGLLVFAVGNAFFPGLVLRALSPKEIEEEKLRTQSAAASRAGRASSSTSSPGSTPAVRGEVVSRPPDDSPIARLMLGRPRPTPAEPIEAAQLDPRDTDPEPPRSEPTASEPPSSDPPTPATGPTDEQPA